MVFSFFEPKALKKSKRAAQAAGLQRQQASDKIAIEMQLVDKCRSLAFRSRDKLLAEPRDGNEALVQLLISIRSADELIQALERGLPHALKALSQKHEAAVASNSIAAYDEVQSAELEIRDSFLELHKQALEVIEALLKADAACESVLRESSVNVT
ncbi:hypothetical protein [Luteimonas arsenica]|uniref:hypothetical protein n=1 Tax=Luteimonas arsenica TaxID=1586242 RepID=UPI00105580EA|nr:hypothetical protein [Luteimonas arsenica]